MMALIGNQIKVVYTTSLTSRIERHLLMS